MDVLALTVACFMVKCFETHHKCKAVIDSLGYSVECSVYSQRNNASFFMYSFVGESAQRSVVVSEVFTA